MPDDVKIKVDGVPEVNHALESVADFDKIKAANRAAEAVIPYVKAGTRILTGVMASLWQAEDAAFVNPVSYASHQEYGTIWIDPTHAIQGAWDNHSDEIVRAYGEEIDSAIAKAGLEP